MSRRSGRACDGSLRRSSGYDELAKRLAKAEARLERQDERLTRHGERLDRHKERLDAVKPAAWRAATLLEVLAAQVGAIEERLQSLTDKVELRGDDADRRREGRRRAACSKRSARSTAGSASGSAS